jgi:D-threo-aldose 1-dehydrogenase
MKTRHWDRLQNGGLTFTELGFGTAPLGNLYRSITDADADAILAAAWEGGVRYFDTAPLYGLGLSETRLNRFLRGKRRDDYVLSTKVGRLLRVAEEHEGQGKWFEVPSRVGVYDYTYDGVMRSVEFSLERLGVARVDILYVHDLDVWTHGSAEVMEGYMRTFLESGHRALVELREQGVIRAFGAGINEEGPAEHLARHGDLDLFLLASRYTLLQQPALESFLPYCQSKGIGVVIGAPYNSGILATGARPGAWFSYAPASEEVLDRVRRIEAVCARHKVRLVDAAFRFPLRHPAVVSVIPGGQGVTEMASNLAAERAEVPDALWADLKAEGLLQENAPV